VKRDEKFTKKLFFSFVDAMQHRISLEYQINSWLAHSFQRVWDKSLDV
jgi:hypothetical protein